jgi:hypothetical protein
VKLAACAVFFAACASAPRGPGKLRFANAEPVMKVNDSQPIEKPKHVELGLVTYYLGEDFIEPAVRSLEVGETKPAANVNSLGEVPDSSWFTNRSPTPEEIRKGPGLGGPSRDKKWQVTGVKVGGAAIGILMKDGRGDTYVLKFDERHYAETETSADVVVQRLTWALGYNVPDNEVVTFKREDLELAPDAAIKDRAGGKKAMKEADLDKYLAMVEHDGDTYRGLASKFITGDIVGGISPEGTLPDDPNDRVPHELRRDLRGQRLLWAWVNHPDIKTQNSLATYDGDHVKWYMLDFGESLGVGARTTNLARLGYRQEYEVRDMGLSLLSFGLYVHPWERRTKFPPFKGLGWFDAESFDPGGWAANHNWHPGDVADRADELWAAEKILKLTPKHIAAAVDAGQYSDVRTREYLTKTLVARQEKIGRYAFSRIAPLVELKASQRGSQIEVCFSDLWLRYHYGSPENTRYRATSFDTTGARLGATAPVSARGDSTCISGISTGATDAGYTIVRIDASRGRHALPPLYVHAARGPDGYRVIGLDRR